MSYQMDPVNSFFNIFTKLTGSRKNVQQVLLNKSQKGRLLMHLISVWLWNFKKQEFWQEINILKGNHHILRIWGAPVRQKFGMILGNKVVQKLKL